MTFNTFASRPGLRSVLAMLALVMGLAGPVQAQLPPELVWATMPGSVGPSGFSSYILASGCVTDPSGQSYVVGTFRGRATFGTNVLTAAGPDSNNDIFLVKYDAAGRVLWAQRGGGVDRDDARSVALDAAGNVFITGDFTSATVTFGTNSLTGYGGALFVAKYGADGQCHWARRAGPWQPGVNITSSATMTPGGLRADAAGNVVVGGTFLGNPQFGGVVTNQFLPYNFSGGVILTNSNTNQFSGSADAFLAKYDATGNLLWARAHGGTNSETVNALALDAAGAVYLAGSFTANTVLGGNTFTNLPSEPGPFVAKFDSLGSHVWSSSLGEGTNGRSASAHSLAVTPSGVATVVFQSKTSPYRIGSLSITNLETDPGFNPVTMSLLARFDAAGSVVWLKKMPFHAVGFGTVSTYVTLGLDAFTNSYAAGYGNWNLQANVNASRGLTFVKYDVNGVGLWTNLVGRNVAFGSTAFGRSLLGIDGGTNLYLAGTLSGDQTTSLPFGWTNIVNGFTNGFGNNIFLAKVTNAYWPVLPQFILSPTNMVFQPPQGLTNSALTRAWPVADYRWYMNSNGVTTRIGTNQLLTLAATTVSNVTTYFVVASNLVGQSTSAVVFAQALLAILPVANSTNAILLGGSGTLSINATGTTAISYQWRFNGTNIAGATSSALVLNNVATNASGPYTVVACNAWGCVTSAPPITVKVVPPGSIDGTYVTQLTGDAAMVRLSDGRLLAAGFDPGYSGATQLYRGLTNGSFDTNFYLQPPELGGTYAWWRSGVFDQQGPRAFVVEPDGKILVGGNFTRFYRPVVGWTNVQKMVRLTADGFYDPTFDVGSGAYDPSDSANNQSGIQSLVRQPDGKLIAAGWFRTFNGVGRTNIVRLNTNGTVDATFTGQTFAYGTDYNNVGVVNALALQPDGKVLVGGNWQRVSGQNRPVLIRLNADGTIDNTFSVMLQKNSATTWPANGFCNVTCIALLPSGKILIGGNGLRVNQTGYDNNAIFQLNADGTVDTNFVAQATGGMTSSSTIAAQADGKILLGGYYNVNRFLPTGALDPEWLFDPSLTAYNIGTLRIMIEPSGSTALMAGTYGIKRILLKVDTGAATPPGLPTGSAVRLPNGQFGFTTCGLPGQALVIQASTNLVNWDSISTNSSPGGCIDFIDPQAPQIPNRYYRVLIQP